MTNRLAYSIIALAALAGLALLTYCAPGYVTQQGFPLDDAWIHAVYGRELARSGMLAYNPQTPATGSTAPLWSAVVALAHLLGSGSTVMVLVKLFGFAFHVLTALVTYAALRDGDDAHDAWRLAGAGLVALHPDLVSASVSGMEVSLASLAAVSLLYGSARCGAPVVAALAALGVLVRPELAVVALTIPLCLSAARGRRALRAAAAAAVGIALADGMLAARNLAVSGLPLPASFYAKVGAGPPLLEALRMGFDGLLRQVPIVDSLLLLTAAFGVAVLLLRPDGGRAPLVAAAGFIGGLAYCAVSFALIAPIDPAAFYHQRYVLPALPLLIGPLPLLLHEPLARRWPRRHATMATAAVVGALCFTTVRHAPDRYAHLANDARNIDDVQVALGRRLAAAGADEVVWAVDAGAVRYFGNAFVVDMMGLNTPELLGENAQPFLNAHPATYVEVVPSWSSLRGAATGLPAITFTPNTPYTVTGFPAMQRHVLVRCAADDRTRFGVRTRLFDLVCAAAGGTTMASSRTPARAGARDRPR